MKINSQRNFYLIGSLFIFILISRIIVGIGANSLTIVEILAWGTLAYLSFAGGFLFPQFKNKDERSQLIKQKGMYITGCALLIYVVAFLVTNQIYSLSLNAVHVVQIFLSLTIITMITSWLLLAKKY
nr:hypothetical protein [uncultured Bacillus sp.]